MDDSPMDHHSIGHASDYCPGIDVHHSSGVFNKAFFLLSTTEGGVSRKHSKFSSLQTGTEF